jgi:uncharacterized protein
MHLRDGDLLFSPTDLVTFLGCAHATFLDRRHASEPRGPRTFSEADQLLARKGLEHEAAYLQSLKDAGKSVTEIPKGAGFAEQIERTEDAMRSGADVIYQAALVHDRWGGLADFLMKADPPSKLGPFSYEPLDTKLARSPKPEHIIQLGVYAGLLAAWQGVAPRQIHVALDGGKNESFREQDFAAYVRHARLRLELFADDPPADSYPQPCAHCTHCHWREQCEERWKRDDHLSLVANVQGPQREALEEYGIRTLAALAAAPAGTHVPDMNPAVFERLRAQAALQLHKRNTGENKFELLTCDVDRGFARLPLPDSGDLFFDMEGDPLHPDGLEYLFGVCFREGDELAFRAFWAHDHGQERQTFGEFMAFLHEHLEAHPNAYVYHYNHYEPTALKRLAGRYAVAEHQLDDLLRQRKFVDLYKVVREGLRVSEPGYSLKNLETFYMCKREGEVANAGDSIIVYNRWRVCRDDKLLRDIAEYNEFDCRSTAALRDWLLALRPATTAWFAGVEPTNEEAAANRSEREQRYAEYQQRLQAAAGNNTDDYRWHIGDLLGFHQREDKPQWWAFFDRQDRLDEELRDDYECLAGLEQVGQPVPVKRSLQYTYRFPPQETKRRPGDEVFHVASGARAGTITDLDEAKCLVRIKIGKQNGALPGRMTVGPKGPLNTEVLRGALYRVADDFLAGGGRFAAVGELLRGTAPRVVGRRLGEPVARGDDLLRATTEAVAGLDRSYLFVQGPPGAGKTYTAAHVIVAMIRRGKRVGIASNSHMAINNLLQKVVELAKANGVKFAGVKKSSGEEPAFDDDYIETVSSNGDVNLDAQLLAGTGWLFADERFDQHLDYLFVDEAGQVSLANVVAMGTSARNLVLIGDQMQLGQPIQGVHPSRAGLSVLDFLLGGQATVAPDRGIFLNRSRRMRPEVCRFISDTFYGGQLHPDPDTSQRRLVFSSAIDGIGPAGVYFHPVRHFGRSQKSEEEGRVVRDLFEKLLKQQFHEMGRKPRALSVGDILVVSPYNIQVNHLRSILPDSAKVGTVDKFQGQEAPAVIVSMATSSAEYLPRDIEFLFSANRLNVAVSRAQCLAIVVASPALLAVPCATIEQLGLVNKFCLLAEYSPAVAAGA